jgi:hypothetical protein
MSDDMIMGRFIKRPEDLGVTEEYSFVPPNGEGITLWEGENGLNLQSTSVTKGDMTSIETLDIGNKFQKGLVIVSGKIDINIICKNNICGKDFSVGDFRLLKDGEVINVHRLNGETTFSISKTINSQKELYNLDEYKREHKEYLKNIENREKLELSPSEYRVSYNYMNDIESDLRRNFKIEKESGATIKLCNGVDYITRINCTFYRGSLQEAFEKLEKVRNVTGEKRYSKNIVVSDFEDYKL